MTDVNANESLDLRRVDQRQRTSAGGARIGLASQVLRPSALRFIVSPNPHYLPSARALENKSH